MLPDFPVQKAFVVSSLSRAIGERLRKDPLVARIHIHHAKEGSAVDVQSPGFTDHVEMEEISYTGEVSLDELIRDGPDAYFKQSLQAAETFIEGHHKILLAKADEITQKHGMVVDAQAKPFSPEMLLEALERMDLSFNERGEPQMPTMVLHPKLLEEIREKMPVWQKDPELNRKFAELLQRKRKDWLDRENSRTLAD